MNIDQSISAQALIGTWNLVRSTAVAADGTVRPAPYGGDAAMGLVTFAQHGRMICVLCDGRPALPDGSPREYNSYCGAWSFDGRQLVTRVDATSNAQWFDTDQVRDVAFDGEILVLRPPLRAYAAQPEQRTLYWEKIS